MKEKRTVVWVDETCQVKGHGGYRVSVVTEGESGHQPTGTWPYEGKPGQTMPWFWGPTIDQAREQCAEYNERMGVSREDAFAIVTASMSKQLHETRKRKTK